MHFLKRIISLFWREPDFYIGGRENPYMMRWYVIPRNRLCNVYLHKFVRDDDDRALHDHPWASLSIILKGKYWEVTKTATGNRIKMYLRFSVIFRKATYAHRIELFNKEPAWTLFITGPKVREWGFHCPKRWVPWQEFCEPTDYGNVGKGCGE